LDCPKVVDMPFWLLASLFLMTSLLGLTETLLRHRSPSSQAEL